MIRRLVLRLFKKPAHPCPPCKLGIDGALSELCVFGCRKAAKTRIADVEGQHKS